MGLPSEIVSSLLAKKTRYQIDRSLRFNDDDSAYCSRTPGAAGNRKVWTFDGWCKRGNLGTTQYIWSAGSAATDYTAVFFDTSNKLNVIRVIASATDAQKVSTALYRDPSAWYNVTVKMDAANTNLDVYVNGVEVTAWDTNNEPSNIDGAECNTVLHTLGARSYTQAGTYFDGYMAYAHFLDGTASAPFTGETNADGVWVPKGLSASYGTTGWYLSFADNTSTTTLGYDDAGSNNWTLNNFSVTAGAGNDSLEDTPTNNYCVISPIGPRGVSGSPMTTRNGNLDAVSGALFVRNICSTVATPTSGKWYFEVLSASGTLNNEVGVIASQYNGTSAEKNVADSGFAYRQNGNKGTPGSYSAYGSTWTTNDIIGVAVDVDNGALYFSKNNTWQNSGDPTSGGSKTGAAFTAGIQSVSFYAACGGTTGSFSFNFGQRPFSYTPPTGFQALCTGNLPTPDIADPSAYMNAVLYTGTGSSLGVTGAGFQPDLVWIKSRSAATDHALYDAVRGVQKQIESNSTTDETTETTGLTAFGSDGFTVGALAQVNTNTATYVAWCWKEGVTPGFDVVTYTGNGSNRTINHNLGAVPKLIIVKARTTAGTDQGWPVYHASNTTAPETDYLMLNGQAGTADDNTLWNDTAPTTTVFSVGTSALVNTNSDTYVAYLFAEVEGFSKFGSYTGNGSTDGPFVWCGFRPQWIMTKNINNDSTYISIQDANRSPSNVVDQRLFTSDASAENSDGNGLVDFLANGFKIRNAHVGMNAGGEQPSGTYIFCAFAEQPFSAPSNAR